MINKRNYLFDRPLNVRRLLRLLYACCVTVLALDIFIHRHIEHPWEELPGFYPLYGFAGSLILVLAAKGLRQLVMRPADYYQRRDLPKHPENSEEAN